MAQFCFGAFRSSSPEVGAAARRGCHYWRGPAVTRNISRRARLDFSRITGSYNSRSYNSTFEIFIRRPLTVSGGKAACAAGRPELEALGG
jgi:hypothetical protein